MDFIEEKDVPGFQHHEQSLHLARIGDVLGKFGMAIRTDFTADSFGEEGLPRAARTAHEDMWKGPFHARLVAVVEIGIQGRRIRLRPWFDPRRRSDWKSEVHSFALPLELRR